MGGIGMNILNQLEPGKFDLHIHTTASDGHYSPSEIVKKAKEIGLETIAITDHDTLSGVNEALQAGTQLGVNVVAGVEITAHWKRRSIDILGYEIEKIEELEKQLSVYRQARITRAEEIIERFCELGMPITLEDVKKYTKNGVIARPHIARAIVEKGYLPTMQIVFDQYLADGMPADVPKKELPLDEALDMIHDAGGVAVLAHPVFLGEPQLIEEILDHGFDGIEVWHRKHGKKEVEKFKEIGMRKQLILTGGSDFHHDEHQLGIPYLHS
jgi:predicted metal-dependent phosphoesterase TrpH